MKTVFTIFEILIMSYTYHIVIFLKLFYHNFLNHQSLRNNLCFTNYKMQTQKWTQTIRNFL